MSWNEHNNSVFFSFFCTKLDQMAQLTLTFIYYIFIYIFFSYSPMRKRIKVNQKMSCLTSCNSSLSISSMYFILKGLPLLYKWTQIYIYQWCEHLKGLIGNKWTSFSIKGLSQSLTHLHKVVTWGEEPVHITGRRKAQTRHAQHVCNATRPQPEF